MSDTLNFEKTQYLLGTCVIGFGYAENSFEFEFAFWFSPTSSLDDSCGEFFLTKSADKDTNFLISSYNETGVFLRKKKSSGTKSALEVIL